MTLESPGAASYKLGSVQLLRAVAALLVLLYHLVNTTAFGWRGVDGAMPWPAAWFGAVGFAGVDLFFVISGVVMVLNCYDRFGERGAWAPFLGRRIARIYPLYWLATFAVLALCWVRPDLTTRDKFSWPLVVKSLALWPESQYPIVAVGWTLVFEMFFYLVFAAMLTLPRRGAIAALAAWGAVASILFVVFDREAYRQSFEASLSLPIYASPLALEFIAGCMIGWLTRSGQLRGPVLATCIGVALLVGLGGYCGMTYPREAQYGMVRALVFGGSAAVLAYGMIGLERRRLFAPARWLTFWGDASYSTYLTHMYALWMTAAIIAPLRLNAWVSTLLGVAVCGVAAAACHIGIERPLLRIAVRAAGGARRPAQRVQVSPA